MLCFRCSVKGILLITCPTLVGAAWNINRVKTHDAFRPGIPNPRAFLCLFQALQGIFLFNILYKKFTKIFLKPLAYERKICIIALFDFFN